jgi:hypothetical protein
MEREMRGRVARHREHLERDACELDRLASGEQDVGVYGRSVTPGGVKPAGSSSSILSPSAMCTGAPVPSARSATPRRWSQWPCVTRIRLAAGAEARERQAELGRITARVDYHGIA